MEGLAGIVFPDVFQIDRQLNPMLEIMKQSEGDETDTFFYKNFHLGITGGSIGINEKKTIVVALNGSLTNYEELRNELKNPPIFYPIQLNRPNSYCKLMKSGASIACKNSAANLPWLSSIKIKKNASSFRAIGLA